MSSHPRHALLALALALGGCRAAVPAEDSLTFPPTTAFVDTSPGDVELGQKMVRKTIAVRSGAFVTVTVPPYQRLGAKEPKSSDQAVLAGIRSHFDSEQRVWTATFRAGEPGTAIISAPFPKGKPCSGRCETAEPITVAFYLIVRP